MFINGIFWFGMFPIAVTSVWGKISFDDVLIDILEHAIPLILLVIDLHLNSVVIWNYKYVKYQFILLLIYLPINVYYTLNVKPIYSLIDYHNFLSLVLILGSILTVPICHFIAIRYCSFFKSNLIKSI
jgi:hypothetical protein